MDNSLWCRAIVETGGATLKSLYGWLDEEKQKAERLMADSLRSRDEKKAHQAVGQVDLILKMRKEIDTIDRERN